MFNKKRRCRKIFKTLVFTRNTNLTIYFRRAFIFVYKGNMAKKLRYRGIMSGFKVGEFAFTKKPFFFSLLGEKSVDNFWDNRVYRY